MNTDGRFVLDGGKTFSEHNANFLQLTGGTVRGTLSVSGSVIQSDSRTAIGDFSFQSGSASRVNGDYCHVEGLSSTVSVNASSVHAEGMENSATAPDAHVLGVHAEVRSDGAFVWNGDRSNTYSDHGEGTFNINPIDGADGVYFGTESLCSLLSDRESQIESHIVEEQGKLNRNTFLVKLGTDAQTMNGSKEFVGAIDAERTTRTTVPTVGDSDDESNRASSTAFAWNSLVKNFLKMFPDTTILQDAETADISIKDKGQIRVYKNVHATAVTVGRLSDCTQLEYCILPNVTSISDNALSGCPSMKQIYLGAMSASFASSGRWGLPSGCIPVK